MSARAEPQQPALPLTCNHSLKGLSYSFTMTFLHKRHAKWVGLAAFAPLTLLFVYLQVAWPCYQSGGITAAIFQPLWLAITSPLWLMFADAEQKRGLVNLFVSVLFRASAFASAGSVIIGFCAHFIAKRDERG